MPLVSESRADQLETPLIQNIAMPKKPPRPWNILKALLLHVFSADFWRKYTHFIVDVFYKDIAFACLLIFVLFYIGYGGFCSIFFLLLCFLSLIRSVEHNLVFHTDEPPGSRQFVDLPTNYFLPYESLMIPSGRAHMHAYLFLQNKPFRSQVPTIIQFHGNAGNIGHRILLNQQLYHTCHVNILSVDYRGFGKSTGSPNEYNLYEDACSAVNYLITRTDIDTKSLVIMGQSLGGAVSIDLLSRPDYACKIKGLILENTFTSMPEIGRTLFNLPFVKSIPDWCLLYQFQSLTKIRKVSCPILFLSGLKDTLIPPGMMRQLYQASQSPDSKLVLFEHGGHNDTWNVPGYYEAMGNYLEMLKDHHQRGDTMNV